jgi:hypothetical protein
LAALSDSRKLRRIAVPLAFRRNEMHRIFRSTNLAAINIREATTVKAKVRNAFRLW